MPEIILGGGDETRAVAAWAGRDHRLFFNLEMFVNIFTVDAQFAPAVAVRTTHLFAHVLIKNFSGFKYGGHGVLSVGNDGTLR